MVIQHMQNRILEIASKLQSEFGEQHRMIYQLIAKNDQVMSTYAIECATEMDADIVALCLGDLVRSDYVRVYQKHGRRPAWEIVKPVALAS